VNIQRERNAGRKVHLNFYEHQYTHGFSASINNQFISVPLLRNQLLKKKNKGNTDKCSDDLYHPEE